MIKEISGWAKEKPAQAVTVGMVALYFVGFHIYYCFTEGWVHPAYWLFHMKTEAQAAWIGGFAGLVAIYVTQRVAGANERKLVEEIERKRRMNLTKFYLKNTNLYEGLERKVDR